MHNNINVQINGKSVPMEAVNSSALFVQVSDSKNQTMDITIHGIINYIRPDVFTLVSMKKVATAPTPPTSSIVPSNLKLSANNHLYDSHSFGFTDIQVVNAVSATFSAHAAATRIIFPNNYAEDAPKAIMALNDYNIPA